MKHKDYIKTPIWINFNKSYRKSKYKQNCFSCDTNFDLLLHHVTYERLGNEKLEDVVVFCSKCHNCFHKQYPSLINSELTSNTHKFIKEERIKNRIGELINNKSNISKTKNMELLYYRYNKDARNKEREIQKELNSFKFF